MEAKLTVLVPGEVISASFHGIKVPHNCINPSF